MNSYYLKSCYRWASLWTELQILNRSLAPKPLKGSDFFPALARASQRLCSYAGSTESIDKDTGYYTYRWQSLKTWTLIVKSSVSSTKNDIDTRVTKAWTAIDRLSIILKSDLTDKMKPSFFQAAVVSILLYGGTTWTLTKRLENKLDGNYTRMLRAILNKSWRQHPTRHQLYGHLPPITKTIQIRRTRHAGHCWRSKDELVSDVLLWTPTYGQAKAGRPARTYIQQLCEDTGCNPEDLPEAMNDREKWRERIRDIRAGGTTWWWWWWSKEVVMVIIQKDKKNCCSLMLSIYYFLFSIQIMNWQLVIDIKLY